MRVTVLSPVNAAAPGYVVYYDTRRAAARRRLDRTLDTLREAGVPATGVVVEADPVSALRDAINQLEPDEVIVSTHPQKQSGWIRRNLVDQMRRVSGTQPVRARRRRPRVRAGPRNVLVVANQTVLGEPLLARIRERAAEGPASFLIISPQGDSEGSPDAERRLLRAVTTLRSEALDVHGQISHPDPYAAVMQTMEDERVNEIIVSTFPAPAPAGCAATSSAASARREAAGRARRGRRPYRGDRLMSAHAEPLPHGGHDATGITARPAALLVAHHAAARDAPLHRLGDHALRLVLHGLLLRARRQRPRRGRRRRSTCRSSSRSSTRASS